jgi:hypothetical protein
MPTSCFNDTGLFNVHQGLYENKPTKQISSIPDLDLAYLSNSSNMDNTDVDLTINLNPITLNWSDFVSLFFGSHRDAFCISSSNYNAYPISFYKQTFQNTHNNKNKFNLADQIIKAWSKKNNKPESSIPPYYKISLNRVGFLTKSLASIKGYVMGLSLDEVFSTLISNGDIKVACVDDFATVNFTISYNDIFEPLGTNILVYFKYTTFIPGYKNVSENSHNCYSNCVKPIRHLSNIKMNNTDLFDLDSASDVCSLEETYSAYPNASDGSVNNLGGLSNKSVNTAIYTHKTEKTSNHDNDMKSISDSGSECDPNTPHNNTNKSLNSKCDNSVFSDWDDNKSTTSSQCDGISINSGDCGNSNVYVC